MRKVLKVDVLRMLDGYNVTKGARLDDFPDGSRFWQVSKDLSCLVR